MIVDSQIHVWEADRTDRPWPADGMLFGHRLDAPMSVDEVLGAMDACGVSRAVLVPPSFEGDRNDLIERAVSAYPERFLGMGRVADDAPFSAGWLEDLLGRYRLTGLRLTFNRPGTQARLRGGEFEPLWVACEASDVPVMLLGPDDGAEILKVAERHPGLRVTVDHCNCGEKMSALELERHASAVSEWAVLDNLSVKASALPCYAQETSPFEGLKRMVYRIVRAFGPERVFWGSDLSRLPCPYQEWRDFVLEGLTEFSDEEREMVMGLSISRWLRWP